MSVHYQNVEGELIGTVWINRVGSLNNEMDWALFDRGTETFSALPSFSLGTGNLTGRSSWSSDGRYLAACDDDRVNFFKRQKNVVTSLELLGGQGGNSPTHTIWGANNEFVLHSSGTDVNGPIGFSRSGDDFTALNQIIDNGVKGEYSQILLAEDDRFLVAGKFNISSAANPYIQLFERDGSNIFWNYVSSAIESNTGLGSTPNGTITTAITSDAQHIAWWQSGGVSPLIRIWSRVSDLSWEIIHDEPAAGSVGGSCISFTPDGNFLYFICNDTGTISPKAYCFDTTDFSRVSLPAGLESTGAGHSQFHNMYFTKDSEYMFFSLGDGTTRGFKLDTVNGGISYELATFTWPGSVSSGSGLFSF